MPTVLRIGPYRFFFFSRESNEPAHIHISAADKEAKVWLATMQLAYSHGFRPHEIKALIKLTEENRETLLEAWNVHFGRNT